MGKSTSSESNVGMIHVDLDLGTGGCAPHPRCHPGVGVCGRVSLDLILSKLFPTFAHSWLLDGVTNSKLPSSEPTVLNEP